jgi:lysine 6-dehydrogenase
MITVIPKQITRKKDIMNIMVLGAGMMGRAIAYDLETFSKFENITLVDRDKKTLDSAEKFLKNNQINFEILDIDKKEGVEKKFKDNDIVISAIPYFYNLVLTQIAIKSNTHFLDLGGNNTIVDLQRALFKQAKEENVTIIPDCGLAPGLTSVLIRNIVEDFNTVDSVKIRVGGLPIDPTPPLNYQIVFSPNGLFNEYFEDAIVLDNGKIISKKSMTEIEEITFPEPFGKMEAFVTSGGCSTLPYTYKNQIGYLDYKTVRYPGHCEKFINLLDLKNNKDKPRDELTEMLLQLVPTEGKDVVLIKIMSSGTKNGKNIDLEYNIVDYYDEKNDITAMMRTTGYPVSIIAQMIERDLIKNHGVFGNEEIVPPKSFIGQLEKRGIKLEKKVG